MEATKCLREEHQVILKVLDCLEIALRRAGESSSVTREVFGPFVEFFRGFADKCHHCKEEDRLFPRMEKGGIPKEGGPIGVMLHEHEQGRAHVRAIDEHLDAAGGGDKAASGAVLDHGGKLITLLRQHIDKEDHCLFAMAEQVVAGDALTELTQAYSEAEAEAGYSETYSRCRAIADRLMQEYDCQ